MIHIVDPHDVARDRRRDLTAIGDAERLARTAHRPRGLRRLLPRIRGRQRSTRPRSESDDRSSSSVHGQPARPLPPPHPDVATGQNKAVASRLYEALHRDEHDALHDYLAPDFVGHIPTGMPGGLGGTYLSREAMIRSYWMATNREFGAIPKPDRMLAVEGNHVIVIGRFSSRPAAAQEFDAAFMDLIHVRNQRIGSLVHICDTRAWPDDSSSHPAATS